MSIKPNNIVAAQLTNAAATYYTAPANTKAVLKKLTFTNNDTAARTVTVYLVPSAGTAGVTNILVSARAVAAGDTYDCTEALGQTLLPAGFIQAFADVASKVTVNGAVAEVV